MTPNNWFEPEPVEVPGALREAVGGHPLVAATLARRGISSAEAARAFLDPDYYTPAPPGDLPDIGAAVDRVARAVRGGEQVCVWGDFDVDGQTATSLLVAALRELGARVSYHIPHRERESHGVNLPALKQRIDGGTNLLLTCDTGVTAHEAVQYARSRGVDVVITDHHALPPALPDARAVVNPKRLPAGHPLYELAGVGCAYKLVEALYAGAGRAGEAAQYLDLVTLGTVADVMALVDDNRYMVQRGLALLRRGERQGVAALMESAEINPEWFTEEHIGFGLGPRLNALGRLDDANRAVDLLTTGDLAEARILARELEGLNIKRKQMTSEVYRAAVAQVERDPALLQYGALVLAHPTWPAGVIGIVANRLVERYGRPAVLLASKAGEPARGSARSVPGCDITAAIAAHAAMLQGFGGHQMAAGLAIDAALIDDFRRALSRTVHDMRGDVPETRPLQIDGYVTLDELTLDFAADVERLAPFGAGNPALTLAARNLEIVSKSIVGRTREHLRLVVRDEAGTAQPVMWWHGADEKLPQGRVDLAFHARASDFKGQRHVELVWVDARPLDPDAITLDAAPAIEVIDHRGDLGALQALVAEGDIAVWAEGSKDAPGVGRDELPSARGLAIWTAPPGPVELADAVERVGPEVVYLFGAPPGLDRADDFLKHLAGMVRYALQSRGGEASLARLAAATTHREATVRAGVEWLAARGDVAIVRDDGSVMQLTRGDGTPREDAARLMGLLKHLLQETREYRKYFSRADKDALISL